MDPVKFSEKFANNAYELELPLGMGILPTFNVVYLYKYNVDKIKGMGGRGWQQ